MRADDDIDFSGFEVGHDLLLLGGRPEAAEHLDARGESGEALLEGFKMLEGQDGRGGQHRHLFCIGDGFEGGAHGYFGFAVADVAAEQAIHGGGFFEVALDVGRWRSFWSGVSSNSKASSNSRCQLPSGEKAKPWAVLRSA